MVVEQLRGHLDAPPPPPPVPPPRAFAERHLRPGELASLSTIPLFLVNGVAMRASYM